MLARIASLFTFLAIAIAQGTIVITSPSVSQSAYRSVNQNNHTFDRLLVERRKPYELTWDAFSPPVTVESVVAVVTCLSTHPKLTFSQRSSRAGTHFLSWDAPSTAGNEQDLSDMGRKRSRRQFFRLSAN